ISNLETRALVRRLRTCGVMRGVIASGEAAEDTQLLLWEAKRWSGMDGLDLAKEVTCKEPYVWEEPTEHSWYIAEGATVTARAGISWPTILGSSAIFCDC